MKILAHARHHHFDVHNAQHPSGAIRGTLHH